MKGGEGTPRMRSRRKDHGRYNRTHTPFAMNKNHHNVRRMTNTQGKMPRRRTWTQNTPWNTQLDRTQHTTQREGMQQQRESDVTRWRGRESESVQPPQDHAEAEGPGGKPHRRLKGRQPEPGEPRMGTKGTSQSPSSSTPAQERRAAGVLGTAWTCGQ